MVVGFDFYQDVCAGTAVYPPKQALKYLSLGLASEAGEVCGKIKKVIRDNNGIVNSDTRDALADELGDVLWYVARMADELGFNLEKIASDNIAKLESRKHRGVLGGSGDNR